MEDAVTLSTTVRNYLFGFWFPNVRSDIQQQYCDCWREKLLCVWETVYTFLANANTNRKARRSCIVDSCSCIRHRCAIAVDSDSKCHRGKVVDYSSVGLGIDFSGRPDHLDCTRMFATQAFGCGSIRRTTQANFAYLRPPLLVPYSDNQSQ
jgi:hypothetical protein